MKGEWLYRIIPVLLIATCVSPPRAVQAGDNEEGLRADALVSACRSETRNPGPGSDTDGEALTAGVCNTYLQGYLAGLRNETTTQVRPTSFEERALQTRAYGHAVLRNRLSNHEYCLPGEGTIALARKVARLNLERHDIQEADAAVNFALDTHFRCRDYRK